MKILQIIKGPYGDIYGVGDNNKVYRWSVVKAKWLLYREEERKFPSTSI